MSGIISLVHRAEDPDGPYKTISEVAEYFEVHIDTARRWVKRCDDLPQRMMYLNEEGTSWVRCFNDEDIQKLAKYSESLRGRKK